MNPSELSFLKQLDFIQIEVLKSQALNKYFDFLNYFSKLIQSNQAFFWIEDSDKPKYLSLIKETPNNFRMQRDKVKNLKNYYFSDEFFYFHVLSQENIKYCFLFHLNHKNNFFEDHEFLYSKLHNTIKTLEVFEKVQEMNFIDDVTGLYNQRYLSLLLDQEIERVNRTESSFCVLFIDVDHFKNVNDNNGHLVGSQILKEIGAIIKNSVRSIDSCFRYGGDEFLTVLTNAKTAQALTIAQRICDSVAKATFIFDSKPIQITLSIGVACFPEHAKTKEKILQVADEAMYCGKKTSRNIVYVAS